MGNEKTLYVSDMDCTLMGEDRHISAESRRLLNEAIADGALFTVATARTPATVDYLLEGLEMTMPAIVMTGGALYDIHTKTYSDLVMFDADTARKIIDTYKRHNCPVFVYAMKDNLINIFHFGGAMNQIESDFIEERIDNPFKLFRLETEELPDEYADNVMLFYAMQPDEVAHKVYEDLKKMDINPMYYHDMFGEEIAIMEAFPKLTTKALAIEKLAKRVGADRIVVFGDNANDLSMFRIADTKVAVENAIPEVREAADIILGPNTDDSVAKYIREKTKR